MTGQPPLDVVGSPPEVGRLARRHHPPRRPTVAQKDKIDRLLDELMDHWMNADPVRVKCVAASLVDLLHKEESGRTYDLTGHQITVLLKIASGDL